MEENLHPGQSSTPFTSQASGSGFTPTAPDSQSIPDHLHHLAPLSRLIATDLNISPDLLHRTGVTLKQAYRKWLAIKDTEARIDEMRKNGIWQRGKTGQNDIITIFVSRSVYFSSYLPTFPAVVSGRFPRLINWLEGGPDAPSDFEIWKSEAPANGFSFSDLKFYVSKPEDNISPPPSPHKSRKRKTRRDSVGQSSPQAGPSKKSRGKGKEGSSDHHQRKTRSSRR